MVKEIIKKKHIQSIIENLGVLRSEKLSTAGAIALGLSIDKLKTILDELPI